MPLPDLISRFRVEVVLRPGVLYSFALCHVGDNTIIVEDTEVLNDIQLPHEYALYDGSDTDTDADIEFCEYIEGNNYFSIYVMKLLCYCYVECH